MIVDSNSGSATLHFRGAAWAGPVEGLKRASRRSASMVWFLASAGSWALLITAYNYFM